MTGSKSAGLNASILALCTALTACGGGGDAPSAPPDLSGPSEPQQPGTSPPTTPTQTNAIVTRVPSVTARNVERYLDHNTQNAFDPNEHDPFSAWPDAPVIRIWHDASLESRGAVIQAVAALNAALPHQWHITVGPDFHGGPEYAGDNRYTKTTPFGSIVIDMNVPVRIMPDTAGQAAYQGAVETGIEQAQIIIREDQSGEIRHHVIVHEILHALGFDHIPPNDFHPDSVMAYGYGGDTPERNIPRIDVEAVRTVYGVLGGGAISHTRMDVEDFGAWNSQVVRIADSNGGYGVDYGNGLAVPWIAMNGTTPYGAPSRSATWRGQLVGMTPNGQPVDGDAAIRVNVASMSGTAMFTDIEHHGTDRPWHGGDLDYAISVTGATFHDASGELAGRFLGHNHARTVGTLDRADLAAAFGASR